MNKEVASSNEEEVFINSNYNALEVNAPNVVAEVTSYNDQEVDIIMVVAYINATNDALVALVNSYVIIDSFTIQIIITREVVEVIIIN